MKTKYAIWGLSGALTIFAAVAASESINGGRATDLVAVRPLSSGAGASASAVPAGARLPRLASKSPAKAGALGAVSVDLSAFSAAPPVVVATMYRLSLDPASLAAVGLSANDAAAMLNAAAGAVSDAGTGLSDTDQAYGAARNAVDQLERTIQSGQASGGQIQSLAGARTTANDALTAREAVLTNIYSAATANLTSPQKAALASIRATQESWGGVPAAYRISSHSDADFLALRGALGAKRISIATGESTPEDADSILQTWAGDTAVATALAAQDANTAAIKSTFDSAAQGGG